VPASELAGRFSPALVTGASGFIGAGLVRRLLELGFDVHVLLRPAARLWRLQGILDRLHVHAVDVTDAAAVAAAVRAVSPRAVFHLATYGAYESQADATRILHDNVLGGYGVLQASIDAGAAVFVNAGSSSEYGFKTQPMKETDALAPNSFYAVSKATMTHLCNLMGRQQSATAITTLRVFSAYGPWEEPTRLFPTLLRRTRAGLPLEMVGPEIARDYVYVDDVIDAFLSLPALASLHGEVLNVGSGIETTLAEVVERVQEVLGRRTEVRWGAMPARKWDTTRWQASPEKAHETLGWKPRHSLRDGIARMAAWMEESEVSGDSH
jgi:nucleoside-diphosphate-sugar epimerase